MVSICLLLSRRKTNRDLKKRTDASGKRGEENLLADVKRFTRFRHVRILTNLYLRESEGRSTEIDLLLLDRDGVFIFESKNYNGMIFGDEQNRNWLHVLRNGDRFQFYNPIWQNSGHVTAVRRALGKPGSGLFQIHYCIWAEFCFQTPEGKAKRLHNCQGRKSEKGFSYAGPRYPRSAL